MVSKRESSGFTLIRTGRGHRHPRHPGGDGVAEVYRFVFGGRYLLRPRGCRGACHPLGVDHYAAKALAPPTQQPLTGTPCTTYRKVEFVVTGVTFAGRASGQQHL